MKAVATTKWSAAPLPSSPSPPENSEFQMKRGKKEMENTLMKLK